MPAGPNAERIYFECTVCLLVFDEVVERDPTGRPIAR